YGQPGAQLPGEVENLVRKNFEGRAAQQRAGAPGRPTAVELPPTLTVRELADYLHLSAVDIIKDLLKNGIFSNINQQIDFDTAAIVADNLGVEATQRAMEERVAVGGRGASTG